ncbi:MAG: hypothetical protein ACREQ5_18670 [Candidatus Dormibacteria bacterium]
MRDHHPYADRGERGSHPLELVALAVASALAVTLLFVWCAGELAGGLWHGAWPAVSLARSAEELLQVWRHPGDSVAAGIPGGAAYFTVLSLMVVTAGAAAAWLFRLLYRPRVYWAPPRLIGRGRHQSFLPAYRQARARRWR